ncbi:MAG: MogA/MoaB family molybdenum cofactor biosynthesis protein [Anaerolineales bacterium]|jgi:molybdenum cofactor synthesis domain-containing protein
MRVAVLTISDRSARGEREDLSGPELRKLLAKQAWDVDRHSIVSDDQDEIEKILIEWADSGEVDLILTTGGTGFSARDRAPEATLAVIDRSAPGLAEAMRASSLKKTPHAMLSRAVSGIRKATLIVNLPGSPRAAKENLQVVLPALQHAVELLRESPEGEKGHHYKPPRPQV